MKQAKSVPMKPSEWKMPEMDLTSIDQLVGLTINFRTAQQKMSVATKEQRDAAMVRIARTGHFLDTWLRSYITKNNPNISKEVDESVKEEQEALKVEPTSEEITHLIKSEITSFAIGVPEEIEVSGKVYTVKRISENKMEINFPDGVVLV